jgi:hypothetical protein
MALIHKKILVVRAVQGHRGDIVAREKMRADGIQSVLDQIDQIRWINRGPVEREQRRK